MPRPSSSGSRGNRRSSRNESSGKGKSFSGRKSSGPSGRFKKSQGDSDEGRFSKPKRSGDKPFKKFDRQDSKPSFRKRSDDRSEKPFRKSEGSEHGSSRPRGAGYGKREGFKKSDGDKPFKKFDRRDSKPSFRKDEGSEHSSKRPRSTGYGKGGGFKKSDGDKPFKKFDRQDSKPSFRKRSDDRPGKSFDSGDSERPSRKPRFGKEDDFKKSDRPNRDKPFKKSFKEERSTGRKSFREKGEAFVAEAPAQTEKIRLNKYIANSGVCSRREADELITMGLVTVNGTTITELGYKVNPGDEVRYEGKLLKAEKLVYILLNKPKGYLTTTADPQERNTVMHIVGNAVKERIYPVGRLDRNTTGLLLLTNDGDLAEKLMHPSYNVKKIYKVELDKPLTKADFQKITEGVHLEEGRAMVDDVAIVSDDGRTVGLELHIGWNRVVRRIFEAMEYQVIKLDRSVYAGLTKKDLGRGEWRFLTREEVVLLKHYKK